MVHTINADDFAKLVLNNTEKLVLVDFYADWCGPCRAFALTLEKVSEKFKTKVKCFKVNVDENPQLASEYQIRGLPTLMLFWLGKKVQVKVKALSEEELEAWLTEHLPSKQHS